MDIWVAVAGAMVGFIVGLTGMGGGALMTPILVLVFGVTPLTAVSSDLLAALVMKPIGGGVHIRKGTVHKPVVRWLVIGSVPSAFLGAVILDLMAGPDFAERMKIFLGATLIVAGSAMALRAMLGRRREKNAIDSSIPMALRAQVRPIPTLCIGVFGGLIVGLTSVGSGSLMIVGLMLLYPGLTTSELVGTDLVQAIPLVGAAALGHLLFGSVEFGLTFGLLVGGIPGVWLGAHLSSKATNPFVRPALMSVLFLSGIKLLGGSNGLLLACVAISAIAVATISRRAAIAERTEVEELELIR